MTALHPDRTYELCVVVGIICVLVGVCVGSWLAGVREGRRVYEARRRGRREVLRWVGRA